jgi:hypothetical protein
MSNANVQMPNGPFLRVVHNYVASFSCAVTRPMRHPERRRAPQGYALRSAAPKPKDLPRPALPAGVPRAACNDGGRSFAALRMTRGADR